MSHTLASLTHLDADALDTETLRGVENVRGQRAVEVTVLWTGADGETSVLDVAHVVGPRRHAVESPVLGACSVALDVSAAGEVSLSLPDHAAGRVWSGEATWTIEELVSRGRLRLPADARASLSMGPITLVIAPTLAARGVARGAALPWDRHAWTLASLALHALVLLIFFLMPPRPPSLSPELLRVDPLVRALLAPEVLDEPRWIWAEEGHTGARHRGDAGALGSITSAETPARRYAIEGRAEARDARVGARGATASAPTNGVLGVLGRWQWDAPSSPFATEVAAGADPVSALGALSGDQIGERRGVGLGLGGVGRGAGGTGLGTLGNGTLGTLGHGSGVVGTGRGSGYGAGAGGFRGRASGVPRICSPGCVAEVRGALSREAIRRVVRQHVNEVRFCYEQGLQERPDLAGRVTLSFVVSEGRVSTASIASTSIASEHVESCLTSAVRRWTFPAADGGGTTLVTYPFVLDTAP